MRTIAETMRVLKPGEFLVFATPSKYYYPMIVAWLTPTWVHSRLVAVDRSQAVRRLSMPPCCLCFSLPLFLAGVLYERTIERACPPLHATLWVTMTKRR